MPPTKKAYLDKFPFITHIPTEESYTLIDPFFNPQFNDWRLNSTQGITHPINQLHSNINPFRNLFAEFIEIGQITWDGRTYTINNPKGFWHTCKRYNINPKFPPVPTFTAPTAESIHHSLVAEYYTLFAIYNSLVNQSHRPYCIATPITPLTPIFQFPLTAKPVSYARRKHFIECSDTSTSEDEDNFTTTNKRLKQDKDYPN
jgi:hypothetical protein